MYKFEETHNTHQNNAEHSSWLILTFSVFTESSFIFVNCMIPLNSTWVPSLGDKTCHCQFVGLHSEQSRIHPAPLPWPTQHQSPTLSLQAVSTSECSFQPPWAPLATATGSTQHHRPAVPSQMAKGTELDPVCSELLCCSLAGETKIAVPPIFVIVLLGSPTSASTENICTVNQLSLKTLTFTSCSGTLTSDKN